MEAAASCLQHPVLSDAGVAQWAGGRTRDEQQLREAQRRAEQRRPQAHLAQQHILQRNPTPARLATSPAKRTCPKNHSVKPNAFI